MVKKFKSKEDLTSYIIENLDMFSPDSLSSEFAINQKVALKICNNLNKKHSYIHKCYIFKCPNCHTLSGHGGRYPVEKVSSIFCDSCGYSGNYEDFDLAVYFENEFVKKKA